MPVLVDRNNEDNKTRAVALAQGLVEKCGIGDTAAILLLATEEMFLAVMHAGTPKVDELIATVSMLIDDLKARVLSHEECARALAADLTDPAPAQVH